MSGKLILKFDPNTIEHLGVSLYSKLPSVLSELISNSWDADADNISVDFIDKGGDKEIIYNDDGDGMTFDELNNKYLVIGRNRRVDAGDHESKKGRKVIGKKGLGKLSVFGICDVIEVISIKNGLRNHFRMDIEKIKSSANNQYSPEIITENQSVVDGSKGTTIHLKKIRRKSGFDLKDISLNLSKKFLVFDRMIVRLTLNGGNEVTVTNELKFTELKEQFRWNFPDKKFGTEYKHWEAVKGSIITTETLLEIQK